MEATVKVLWVCALAAGFVLPAHADDAALRLTLKDHKFTPAEIEAPAGKPFTLEVVNQDSAAAEIESKELRFEKLAPAGGKAVVKVRALTPGRYRFFDDYHESTAQGYVVVK
jgi:hypothetical protein